MTDVETAWLAGLLEGEGSFMSWKVKRDRSNVVRIQMSSTDEDVIERVAAITGVGRAIPIKTRPTQLGTKPAWMWQLASKADVRELSLRVLPYLSRRRSEQVADVLRVTEDIVMRPQGVCINGHEISGDNAQRTGPAPNAFACKQCIADRRRRQRQELKHQATP